MPGSAINDTAFLIHDHICMWIIFTRNAMILLNIILTMKFSNYDHLESPSPSPLSMNSEQSNYENCLIFKDMP